jgi:hypothetical protein
MFTCTNGNSSTLWHKEGGVTLVEASDNAMQSNAGTRRLVKPPMLRQQTNHRFELGTAVVHHVLVVLFIQPGYAYCLHQMF